MRSSGSWGNCKADDQKASGPLLGPGQRIFPTGQVEEISMVRIFALILACRWDERLRPLSSLTSPCLCVK